MRLPGETKESERDGHSRSRRCVRGRDGRPFRGRTFAANSSFAGDSRSTSMRMRADGPEGRRLKRTEFREEKEGEDTSTGRKGDCLPFRWHEFFRYREVSASDRVMLPVFRRTDRVSARDRNIHPRGRNGWRTQLPGSFLTGGPCSSPHQPPSSSLAVALSFARSLIASLFHVLNLLRSSLSPVFVAFISLARP